MTAALPDPSDQADSLVRRSLEIILSSQAPNGAFLASPSFEQYRYAWLRDGAFMAEALDLAGAGQAARRFHDWVAAVVLESRVGMERSIDAGRAGQAPTPDDYLHCRYQVDGRPGPDDWPTFQLDGPGIWLWSLGHHVRTGGALGQEHLEAARLVGRYLAALWARPSYDAWEEFPEHVHTSTLAAILAGLVALRLADPGGGDSGGEMATARVALEARLGANGGSEYTKWSGNDDVDASLLWLAAPYGLIDPRSPRFARTLRRIEEELVSEDGGVHRYRADTYYGGGEWLLLTAALGRVYLRRNQPGDRARAIRCREWIERQAGPDGSLPEQVATVALAPAGIDEWQARWGESASPLVWSHAAYLALCLELRDSR